MSTNYECPLGLSPETLSAWRDQLVTPDEARRIEAHVHECAACRERLAAFEQLARPLRAERVPDPDERLWLAIRGGMARTPPRGGTGGASGLGGPPRRAWSAVAAVAAILLVAIGFAALFGTLVSSRGTTARPTPTATPTAPVSQATATPGGTPTPSAPASWTKLTGTPAHTFGVTVAPSSGQIVYLCANNGPAASPLPATSRLYKSTNGGQTWQLLSSTPRLQTVPDNQITPLPECKIFVDAADANDVFFQQIELDPQGAGAAVARALARSRDGGATWQQLGTMTGTDGFDALAVLGTRLIAQPHPSILGASQCDPSITPKPGSEVYGSDDGGMTWHDLGQPIESQGYSPHDFALAGSVLFASSDKVPTNPCNYQIVSRLWKSTNGGTSWVSIATPSQPLGRLSFTPKASGSGYYGIMSSYPYQVGSVTPLYSSDSGTTWTRLPIPTLQDHFLSGLVVAPSGAVLTDMDAQGTVDAMRPGTPGATWTTYAPDNDSTQTYNVAQWQLVPIPAPGTIWAVSADSNGASVIEHLPLP